MDSILKFLTLTLNGAINQPTSGTADSHVLKRNKHLLGPWWLYWSVWEVGPENSLPTAGNCAVRLPHALWHPPSFHLAPCQNRVVSRPQQPVRLLGRSEWNLAQVGLLPLQREFQMILGNGWILLFLAFAVWLFFSLIGINKILI